MPKMIARGRELYLGDDPIPVAITEPGREDVAAEMARRWNECDVDYGRNSG